MADPVHLLVCIHGLWGNPAHLAHLASLADAHTTHTAHKWSILIAASNAHDNTYDGIDWCAERAADEIRTHVASVQADGSRAVTRFSVIGYSLGGLVARYLLAILHTRGFFDTIEPRNFITIATPHIGLPRYPGLLSACFNALSPRFLSRTGEQLSLTDTWSHSRRPLLAVMADTNSLFFQTLAQFPHIHIYANAINDHSTPYLTAAIELEDPFLAHPHLQIDMDPDFPPLIKSTFLPPTPAPLPPLTLLTRLRALKPKPLLIPIPRPLQPLIYLLLPLLAPLLVTYILLRLSRASRASRVRILGLERTDGKTGAPALLQSVLEDAMGAGGAVVFTSSASESPGTSTPSTEDGTPSPTTAPVPKSTPMPTLTPLQRTLTHALNTLPLQKHLALITGVYNAHGVIMCRDVGRYEVHRRGEGVLRHLVGELVW